MSYTSQINTPTTKHIVKSQTVVLSTDVIATVLTSVVYSCVFDGLTGGCDVDGFNGETRHCLCSLLLSISGDNYTRNIHRCESRNVYVRLNWCSRLTFCWESYDSILWYALTTISPYILANCHPPDTEVWPSMLHSVCWYFDSIKDVVVDLSPGWAF